MSFNGLLNQTVTITAGSARDKFGKLTFGSGTDYKARFEKTSKNIFNKQNELEPIDGVVFVKPDTTVSIGDRLVHNSLTYKVMKIDEVVVGTGTLHHKELMVQEWSL